VKVLITSALLYANGQMHLGHLAGAYLPADCFARFCRLKGRDVHFLSGSDEYGVAITLSAELEKRSPKAHVDHYHALNKALFDKLDFSFDIYARTTWEGHKETTCEFFRDLDANGYIEKKTTEQLYSENEGRFLADRYVVGTCPKCGYEKARGDECPSCAGSFEATDLKNPRSKLTNAPLILKETTHWFLRFDKLSQPLSEWIAAKDWKPSVKHFAKNYIDNLEPRSITRDLDWGIPVPDAEGKVFYVWFDAPIGYISASREWSPEKWRDYWCDPKTRHVQFIGKDNIPFHAVFFPGMLLGQNQPYKRVDELPANEFLNLEGKQFSKSEGWTIDLAEMIETYGADKIRFATAATAPETSDTEFTWKGFQQVCNGDLVGKLGNFAHRTLTFCAKWSAGQVPPADLRPIDRAFLQEIAATKAKVADSLDHHHLRAACSEIMQMCSQCNVYFDAQKPWTLAKDPSKHSDMLSVLRACLEALEMVATALSPICPSSADRLWNMIGHKDRIERWEPIEPLKAKAPLPPPTPLFTKIEDSMIEKELAKLVKNNEITFDDFTKIELIVGKIVEAETVAKSDKLLRLIIDMGQAKRQVVSGIAKYYSPEDILGKHVVVVANLKKAKLMGIESEGMVLCGEREDGGPLLLSVDNLGVGTRLS